MKLINQLQALDKIKATNGKVFSVIFLKKDGTNRHMNCRLGVTKYVNGKGLKYDPKDYNLITVFDMTAKGYRMINLETIKTLQIKGEIFTVA